MFEDLIDRNVKEGSGLIIGDVLTQENNHVFLKSRVIGFDSSGCPFVKFTNVIYKKIEDIPDDPYEVGDVLPFPWSNPKQFKL